MSSKHFLSDPTHLVQSALHSITLTNPSVLLDTENKIIYRRPASSSSSSLQVSIVSGGGSGHEPSFAAFVGDGLLSAAVAGTIFASPSAEQIRRAILGRVEKGRGVLVVVMNYTGDVLNFGMAVEKAKASGIDVEMVVVGDDAGVGRTQGGKVGRRGIAGTVLVHKIAGALAAQGASLKEVHSIAELVSKNLVSIGASLSHVHVPGRGVSESSDEDLTADEVEIGMGIHNEPGSEKKSNVSLPELVKTMLAHMLDPSDEDRNFLQVSGQDDVVLLINNLGSVSVLELGGITTEVAAQLESDYKIKPKRIISGTFMTSLNGLGFSISILKLESAGLGSSMLDLLDAPAEATGWSAAVRAETWEQQRDSGEQRSEERTEEAKKSNLVLDTRVVKKVLESGLKRLIRAEPDITNYDTIVGDGDCGIGLKRGADAILRQLEFKRVPDDAALFVDNIVSTVETSMDGTSGALYAIFLNALSHNLRQQSSSSPTPLSASIWAKALDLSLKALAKYTPAKPGDRTLIDALHPFVETLRDTGDLKKAAKAAEDGATSTREMKASLGRTVYVGGEGWHGVPDPGAYGLAEFLGGLADGVE